MKHFLVIEQMKMDPLCLKTHIYLYNLKTKIHQNKLPLKLMNFYGVNLLSKCQGKITNIPRMG